MLFRQPAVSTGSQGAVGLLGAIGIHLAYNLVVIASVILARVSAANNLFG